MAALLEATDSARKQSLAPPPTTALDNLKLLGQNAPAPLGSVLNGVAGNADALRLNGARSQLDVQWSASVAPLCQQALGGRYPLVAGASRDAAPDDFARVLGPGGLIDDFFQKNLQNDVDMSGARWRWRPQALSIGIPDDVLAQFQRAAQIRDALFRDGSHDVSVRFSIKLLQLDPAVKRFVLDIDGQQFVATPDTPTAASSFQWQGGKAAGQAHIEFDPTSDGTPASHADGPWAWLRLLNNAAQVQQAGQPDRFRVSFGGGKAILELDANSVVNPFRAGVLDGFRCPPKL